MFPLKDRKLIRGCQAHIQAGLGCAADYVAITGTPLYAPFDGVIETYWGNQGGNWTRLIRSNGDRIEMAHLERYVIKSGNVRSGDLIAYTGNTGAITTGSHKHIQVIRDGKRIDPNAYNWEDAIIPPMACEAEKEEIRKLNTEIGVVTRQRDNLQTELDVEREGHRQTLEQLKISQAEVNSIEAELKVSVDKIIKARLALE